MVRSCVICRQKKEANLLFRLQFDQNNRLAIVEQKQLGQRSAWICCDRSCILKLQKKTIRVQKTLRKKPEKTVDLLLCAQKLHLKRIRKKVQDCYHSGALKSGKKKTILSLEHIQLLLLANPRLESYWRARTSKANVHILALSAAEFGNWINQGPRQVVGILPNRHLRSLNEHLHSWDKLR